MTVAVLVYLVGAAWVALGLAYAARRDPERLSREVLPLAVLLLVLAVLAWPATLAVVLACAASIRWRR